MKLLMASGDAALARGERGAFYNTLSGLAPHWDRIDVLTPPVRGAIVNTVFGNVHIHPSPWLRPAQPLHVLRRGRALVDEHQHDLIASHDYGLCLNGRGAAALSRATGVPYVSEIHHVDGYPRAGSARERLQPALTRQYVRWARRRALGFRITNETELRPLLVRWGVPAAQIHLLYSLYLDLGVFQPGATEKEYDALFVGRLASNKNPRLFLEGLARMRVAGLRALMLGDGPLRGAMRRTARRLGLEAIAAFREWVDSPQELAEIYRRSRCLVCTSFSEGGPRVVAEALACGVPVISTRVGLATELIEYGHNGFLIDWTAADLATHLTELLGSPVLQAQLGSAAPAAVRRFEKARVLGAYAQAYQELARAAGPAT